MVMVASPKGSEFRVQGSGFRKYMKNGGIILGLLPHGRMGPAAITIRIVLLS
jgi:hypothetical protein